MGIAVYPESGTDAETLIKNADMAMYEAKEAGKNGFRFHALTLARQKRQRPGTNTRKNYPPAADLHIRKSGT
jgi:predicted signal transduction protein with EAL and GGDEF domain